MKQAAVVSAITPEDSGKGIVPNALHKLPIGSVKVAGWLRRQLEIELNGIPGQLWKYSPFLAKGNGWLEPEKTFQRANNSLRPWEEQPYWLRTFIKLAILTQDKESLAVAKRYLDVMLKSQQPDGWFGPQWLKHFPSEIPGSRDEEIDLWPHAVVLEGVLSWYEYTQEPCWLELIHKFLNFCNELPEDRLIPNPAPERNFHWFITIQYVRACDMLPVINRVIELTGDETLTALCHKLFRKWEGPLHEFLSTHNVNFSQMICYEPLYSRVSRQQWHRDGGDFWYNQHQSVWGRLPREAFCADENIRRGCTDPRYATESCTWAEFTRSFNCIGELNAEPIWADRTEDVIFNHYPASYTEDMKGIHYLTACNQVMLDDYDAHNVANRAHMFAYSKTGYRCCLHNAGLGWPLFMEYLMTETADNGICAWLHGAYTASAKAGVNQVPVKWTSQTDYPFRHTICFTLETSKSVEFPFYIRIPRWCKTPVLKINGEEISCLNSAGKLVKLERLWNNGDCVELQLPAEITTTINPRNGGVTVDRGPFSYSLLIPDKRQVVVADGRGETYKKEIWNEAAPAAGSRWLELLPTAPWNYGLMPEKGFAFEEHPIPEDYVFSAAKAPMTITASAKKIPAWKLQDHMCAPLQNSPVRSAEPEEKITLIPLGCARLRLSVFPVIGDTAAANEWREVPETTPLDKRPELRK